MIKIRNGKNSEMCKDKQKEIIKVTVTQTWKHNPKISFNLFKGGNPAAGSPTATLLRLNPSHFPHRVRLPLLQVSSSNSGKENSHGLTGGVYKTRERIHRSVLIYDY